MFFKHRFRFLHKISQKAAPYPVGKEVGNRLIGDIMRRSAGGGKRVFVSLYLAYMPVTHPRIKMHLVVAQIFI
jgi:hypothetical protein